jgi:hypothetical protein
MNLQCGRRSFCFSVLTAVVTVLWAGTSARAQHLYQLDWGQAFNNSATSSDTQDGWVANSYRVSNADRQHIVAITLPIGITNTDIFTNKPISALIYQGFDLLDPTAGGGLVLMQRTDTTFTTTGPGQIVTITLSTPVDFNVGDIMYAAVLIPGVPPNIFPFNLDNSDNAALGTMALNRSFFDTGLNYGGAWDQNQGSDNITVLGGTHPVVGPGIQSAGNLALWVNATALP